MSAEPKYYKVVITGLLLMLLFSWGLIRIYDYIGIPLGNPNTDTMNIIGFSLGFIGLLFTARIVYFIFFNKHDGNWSDAGKARWWYCLFGAVIITIISSIIEYLDFLPEFWATLLEAFIAMIVAFLLYTSYFTKFKNTATIEEQKIEKTFTESPEEIPAIIEHVRQSKVNREEIHTIMEKIIAETEKQSALDESALDAEFDRIASGEISIDEFLENLEKEPPELRSDNISEKGVDTSIK